MCLNTGHIVPRSRDVGLPLTAHQQLEDWSQVTGQWSVRGWGGGEGEGAPRGGGGTG